MLVLSSFVQIQLRPVTNQYLMASIQCPDSARVHLISITKVDAMEIKPKKKADRVHRAVGHASIQLMLAPMISNPPGNIGAESHPVISQHGSRMYSV